MERMFSAGDPSLEGAYRSLRLQEITTGGCFLRAQWAIRSLKMVADVLAFRRQTSDMIQQIEGLEDLRSEVFAIEPGRGRLSTMTSCCLQAKGSGHSTV